MSASSEVVAVRERAGVLDAHRAQLVVDRPQLLERLGPAGRRQLEETEDGPALGGEEPVANAVADRQATSNGAPGETLVALVCRDERPRDQRTSEVQVVTTEV